MNSESTKIPASRPSVLRRELFRGLAGALNMARDRGYVAQPHNQLLTPPPRSASKFFQQFPVHFDMMDPAGGQVVRFEFWDVPLSKLPGKKGRWATGRARRAISSSGSPGTNLRLLLVVPEYTLRQKRREQRALSRVLGARLELFNYRFFAKAHLRRRLPHLPEIIKNRMQVQRFEQLFGSLANLPKVRDADWVCRYLGAGPGDLLSLSSGDGGTGGATWRLVVPTRKPRGQLSDDVIQRVKERRANSAKFMGYLKTIREDPDYY